MDLYFVENVYFVKGYKNAAIYDTNNNKVYAINNDGKYIIEKLLAGKEIKEENEKQYLDELKKLNLLTNEKKRFIYENRNAYS